MEFFLQMYTFLINIYRNWPWVQSGFLTLHALTMIMKIHSYMATNGYFANTLSRINSLENLLMKLKTGGNSKNEDIKKAINKNLRKRLNVNDNNDNDDNNDDNNENNDRVGTPIGSNELETANVEDIVQHPLTNSSNPEIASIANEINELKSTITSQGSLKVTFPQNVTISNFWDYLLVPTLVYELEYPRTEKVRLSYILEKTLATFGTFYILC